MPNLWFILLFNHHMVRLFECICTYLNLGLNSSWILCTNLARMIESQPWLVCYSFPWYFHHFCGKLNNVIPGPCTTGCHEVKAWNAKDDWITRWLVCYSYCIPPFLWTCSSRPMHHWRQWGSGWCTSTSHLSVRSHDVWWLSGIHGIGNGLTAWK